MRAVGWKSLPGPVEGGPVSMDQDEGASMLRMGMVVLERAVIIWGKGSRTSPEKENPKMASITESVSWRAELKSSMNGMERSFSWVDRR